MAARTGQYVQSRPIDLGVKDRERFLDMNRLPWVPLFFSNDIHKKQLVNSELSCSPFIWISHIKPGKNGYGRFNIFTRSKKIELELFKFDDGPYYFSVGGIFPKKQRDTINCIKIYIQCTHHFVLYGKGEGVNVQPGAAVVFYNEIVRMFDTLKIKSEIADLEEGPEETEEIFEPEADVVEFCNLHTALIDSEEKIESAAGYDFTYKKIEATEKNDNLNGVAYTFNLGDNPDNLDWESLKGAEVVIKEGEEAQKSFIGNITDTDSISGKVTIKFSEVINFYDLPQTGFIKKSSRNLTYGIQKSAFKSLLEGKAVNNSILDVILKNKYKPFAMKSDINIERFTASQQKALNKALSTQDFLLVQGPPGTGKTEIIVEIIEHFAKEGKKVLISSKNNLAVDNVLDKCIDRKIKCIRLGRAESVKVEKVKKVLSSEVALYLQQEMVGQVREHQSEKNKESELNKLKLQHSNKLLNGLREFKAISNKLIWRKIVLFFYKLIALIRIIKRESEVFVKAANRVLDLARAKEESRSFIEEEIKFLGYDQRRAWRDQDYIQEMMAWLERRIGDAPKIRTIVDSWLEELDKKENALTEVIMADINVVGATCIGVNTSRNFSQFEYDVAIIDEAGQITLHDIIVPITKARKVIMIGDHMQLPPVADDGTLKKIAEDNKDLEADLNEIYKQSLFEKLFYSVGEDNKVLLDTQFRMHEAIAAPISALFYEGKYKTGCKTEHRLINIAGFTQTMYYFDTLNLQNKHEHIKIVSVEPKQVEYTNPLEAGILSKAAVKIIEALDEGIIVMDYKGEKTIGIDDLGIITPYKAQIRCIKEGLSKALSQILQWDSAKIKDVVERIEINSVDSFQGRDKEIILFSFVRSNDNGDIGFLSDLRRLNVTITRAKRLIIMVGDSGTLVNARSRNLLLGKRPQDYFRALVNYTREKGFYRLVNEGDQLI